MNYGYLDKYNILHITKYEETAKEYAKKGFYTTTDLKGSQGYPHECGDDIVVYSLNEAYIEGNATNGKRVNLKDYKATYNLYQSLSSAK